MRKKLSALLLALLMAFSILPASAFALSGGSTIGEIKAMETGESHMVALTADGSVYTWGANLHGEVGDGTTTKRTTPVKVMDDVIYVAAGSYHTLAIKSDHSLWGWGQNSLNQLGDGTRSDRKKPIKIMDDVAAVSATNHTLAIRSDGSLWGWGYNSDGQLGDGSKDNKRSTPQKIMDNVKCVSAGSNKSGAVKTDGTLWIWGGNINGMSGLDKNVYGEAVTTPVKFMDNVASFSAYGSCLAVKTDGTLWSWGANTTGTLGDGTTTHRTTPKKIMDDVASCGVSLNAAMAVKKDGTLWTWGMNSDGQLGDWTMQNRYTPLKILDNVAYGSISHVFGAAVMEDGSLWTWGENNSQYGNIGGMLGNGGGGNVVDGKHVCQTYPIRVDLPALKLTGGQAPQGPVIETGGANPQANGTAYASTQKVYIDGLPVNFEMYALKDSNGFPTNYIKLRDLAFCLTLTKAKFNVGYDGKVVITRGEAYQPNLTEMHTPFSGDRSYRKGADSAVIDGVSVGLQAFVLTDDSGGDYTYYKLRDLGQAIGFNVGWDSGKGAAFIETDKPYTGQ